jgi:predicted TPR repeat methyltransferase
MAGIVAGRRPYDRAAMNANFEQAKNFFMQGVGHYEAGRFEQARAQFAASLSLVPGRASTLMNLGATLIKLGRFDEAVQVLEEAQRARPGDAETLGHLATALAELGRHRQALEHVDAALWINSAAGVLWTLRGNLLKDLGRFNDAAEAFKQALNHGGDAELHRYYLAGLTESETPPVAPPRRYVQSLFDGYANGFEDHLVQVLHYRAPEILVRGMGQRHFDHVLDLGCGTGLCGQQLRPISRHITGVDLSANMVEQARARAVYDEVVHADLVEYLAGPRAPHDLVIAADVFIYVGALEAVFAAVQQALAPGGVFAFTVELAAGPAPMELRTSLRYAHSRAYIESLAKRLGLEFMSTAQHPIREDQGQPIDGLFVWLVRP